MKKSSLIASFSGALVAASLALAGPAAAAGGGHGHGPAAPGHDVSAAPAVQSSGGFAPAGLTPGRLDGLGDGVGTAELPIAPVGGSQAPVGAFRGGLFTPAPVASTPGISTPAPVASMPGISTAAPAA